MTAAEDPVLKSIEERAVNAFYKQANAYKAAEYIRLTPRSGDLLETRAPTMSEEGESKDFQQGRIDASKAAVGLRYNKGKRRMDLLPPDVMAALADLLTRGAEKYAERNWELGMDFKDALGSLERHLLAWKAGQDRDDETGSLEMVHVMCNAMFLAAWQMRDVGKDDRVKVKLP